MSMEIKIIELLNYSTLDDQNWEWDKKSFQKGLVVAMWINATFPEWESQRQWELSLSSRISMSLGKTQVFSADKEDDVLYECMFGYLWSTG